MNLSVEHLVIPQVWPEWTSLSSHSYGKTPGVFSGGLPLPRGALIMATAFSGPYVDQSLTNRAPFSPTSAPAAVTDPPELGETRVYTAGRIDPPRSQDYASQDGNTPKPFPGEVSEQVAYDPYANGGGVSSYLDNAG